MITEIMKSLSSWNRASKVLLAIGSIGIIIINVHGQDEYMTCSRPTKSSRASRQHVQLPCDTMDHGKESWCTLPGPYYPWHSVRRFVFENQGLMRRMYGEVRQLSVLRMEFSGDDNAIGEESRDFDDLFKPITTAFDTASTFSSFLTTESLPTLVVTDEDEQPLSNSSPVPSTTSTEKAAIDNIRSSNEDKDPLTTIPDLVTTTEEIVESDGSVGATEESVPQTTNVPLAETSNEDTIPQIQEMSMPPTGDESLSVPQSQQPPLEIAKVEEVSFKDADEKTRNEGQVIFQDFDKISSSTTTPLPTVRTSSEEPRIRTTTNRQGVNACPVKEEVVAPYWANNTRGEVLALLNLYPFEQYIHWEKCTNEHRQMYCRDGCRCEQQYRLHRLLAFDPQNECRGIFSDWFRFPSCCVCKCYFDDLIPERVSFNRSPRVYSENFHPSGWNNLDEPDVNGVDDSHFFYKYSSSFRQPRK